MTLTAFQIVLWIVVALGLLVSISGIFIIRYYAKRPINGEQKTIKRHEDKIKETKEVISDFKDKFHNQSKQWTKREQH